MILGKALVLILLVVVVAWLVGAMLRNFRNG
jgi:hypothetical protein